MRRKKNHDYSMPGAYFVTINVKDRKRLLGRIENKEMILSEAGKMIEDEWLLLPDRFPNVKLHAYTLMPDHFHAVLEILETKRIGKTRKPLELGDIVGAFESIATVKYIKGVKEKGWPRFNKKLFQRGYWDVIVRNGWSFDNITQYIRDNPKNWDGE